MWLSVGSPDRPAARGRLRSITPDEQRRALVLALSRNLANRQSDDELIDWRSCILSTVVAFTKSKYNTDDDLVWAATNQCEPSGNSA
jgi:hypothetical protein